MQALSLAEEVVQEDKNVFEECELDEDTCVTIYVVVAFHWHPPLHTGTNYVNCLLYES